MKKYGADGVRVGMLLSSPAGNDLLFDSALCEQGRNFSNKLWNAFRLVKSWEVADIEQPASSKIAVSWFNERFDLALNSINESYDKFRMSEALMQTYKLVWDDFCSWYLEMIKPSYQQPIDKRTYDKTIEFFESLLKVVHPFAPFISEEIWHLIDARDAKATIMLQPWPKATSLEDNYSKTFTLAEEVISNIRTIRKDNNIAQKVKIDAFVKGNDSEVSAFNAIIEKICNTSEIKTTSEKINNAFTFIVGSTEYFIPFSEEVDVESEIKKIKEELEYTKGFLNSVDKKLSNEKFVSGAPAQVLEMEQKKKQDAQSKIKILEEKLASLV
jgi:valyl-tRNA synthetase